MQPSALRGGGAGEKVANPAAAHAPSSPTTTPPGSGPDSGRARVLPPLGVAQGLPSLTGVVPESPRGAFGGKGIAVTVRNLTFEVVDNRPKQTKSKKGGGGKKGEGEGAAAAADAAAAAAAFSPPATIKEHEEADGRGAATHGSVRNPALHEIVVDGAGVISGSSSASPSSSPLAGRATAAAAAAAAPSGAPPQQQQPPASRARRLVDALTGAARKPRLALLSDVTAAFPAGRLTALMGPSGSGKSTLLDLMSGRKTTGRVTGGTVLFAGQRASAPFLRRYAGYVEQFDTLLPVLTPREMLVYTADLKRPLGEGRARKEAAVEAVLEKLALRSCADVVIGSALRKGISGGQSKRTNIGIALVTSPRVLFLGESSFLLLGFLALGRSLARARTRARLAFSLSLSLGYSRPSFSLAAAAAARWHTRLTNTETPRNPHHPPPTTHHPQNKIKNQTSPPLAWTRSRPTR